jgi:hypothetical protein
LADEAGEAAKVTEEELEALRMRELNLWRRFCSDVTSQARANWRMARLEYEAAKRRKENGDRYK